MKVFWVLGYEWWDAAGDNFEASFETYEEAHAFVESEKAKEYGIDEDGLHYEIINITDRL
jgi:hypothetical protein